jgi:hypothetical protein
LSAEDAVFVAVVQASVLLQQIGDAVLATVAAVSLARIVLVPAVVLVPRVRADTAVPVTTGVGVVDAACSDP